MGCPYYALSIMEYVIGFFAVGAVALLGAISPGPDFAMVVKNALLGSKKAGVATALGVAVGCLVHVLYSIVGIGALVSQSILAFTIVKWLGALYLLYLGAKMLLSKNSGTVPIVVAGPKATSSFFVSFKQGFITNVLNPKATLFFLAIFTQVISLNTPLVIKAAYGVEVAMLTGAWFVLLTALLNVELFKKCLSRSIHRVEQTMGAVLILLAGKVAFDQR